MKCIAINGNINIVMKKKLFSIFLTRLRHKRVSANTETSKVLQFLDIETEGFSCQAANNKGLIMCYSIGPITHNIQVVPVF